MNERYWQYKWNVYKRIVQLVHITNSQIGVLVVISYGSNLYFTCLQIMYCLRRRSSIYKTIHSWLGLISLILRLFYLSVTSTKLSEEAKRLVSVIKNIPTSMISVELERFMEHLNSEKIVITGMNFFSLNKSLLLKVSLGNFLKRNHNLLIF